MSAGKTSETSEITARERHRLFIRICFQYLFAFNDLEWRTERGGWGCDVIWEANSVGVVDCSFGTSGPRVSAPLEFDPSVGRSSARFPE